MESAALLNPTDRAVPQATFGPEDKDRLLSGCRVGAHATELLTECSLTVKQAGVLILTFWQDMTEAEIGAVFGVSQQTIHGHLVAGLGKVKNKLSEYAVKSKRNSFLIK